jgi:hypothetical protein|tara:strand:+ start:580 stop:741 length:162 start_codon:yes stop_codon:yes gene_type:complete
MNERTRATIYRVLTGLVPVLAAYGMIEDSKVGVIVAALGAVFGTGLASMNTSR